MRSYIKHFKMEKILKWDKKKKIESVLSAANTHSEIGKHK